MKKLIFLITFVFFLTSCEKNDKAESFSKDIFAMDTYMNLKAYGENADITLDMALDEIRRLENLLSVTNEESDLFKINNSNGKAVEIGDDTAGIIKKAIEMGDFTDGCLDISVYPVLKEWGFTTGEYKVPETYIIDSLIENVDYHKIKLDGNTISIPENFRLDLGALAKGYTSDRITEIFKENGVESAIISLGGNVHALGRKPDGSPWKVAVANPFSPDKSMAILETEDKAVITSGDYERFFIAQDGRKYHHIIDPETGRPSESGLVSVTVIGESGILCDALSTALFVSGFDNAVDLWQKRNDFEMILVTEDRKIFFTDGLDFKNISDMDGEIICRQKN